ncbi:LacI family DNA-binding transcriptional regulator [Phreatobacter sp. AB_2022a]|uniref:LacI family DNA-binding transcriptional regulator n=1 Tax=Phreatobacter sp. AB_2022a TaxID=3003134 RepID=UPI0022870150|nr:LacI family DNA-binding transcriptional regulator [Phreatobacter sp. AB_2022a]MCZ0734794.1 LacI family DNA-binding transcriptional regulator [Phreatobacter sp. AB_2022a]
MTSSVSEPRPRVNLRRLADAVGVHPSTVSRALDPAKRHLVADDVADRIIAAARELGYRPNPVAASLRTRRSTLVGVLVPDITNPVFSPIISGIAEVLGAEGYSTIVADAGSEFGARMALIDELIARRVDGLVLATVSRDDPMLEHCLAEGIHVVLVNRADDADRAPSVVSDDVAGMRVAVEHLHRLGHRAIGHLAGPSTLSTGHLRRLGFEQVMREHGLAVPAGAIVEARSYDRDEGERATAAMLDACPGVTAIAAANDLLALGAYKALAARGLACPRDVSVVGHNDMPLVDMVEPPLTTIRIGPRDMGRDAARLLLERMTGSTLPARRIVLAPDLVERASTAPPRAGA